MKFVRRVGQDVRHGDNIDLYVAVVAAVGVAILNVVGAASQALVASVTLAVLAVLATAAVVSRHRLEESVRSLKSEPVPCLRRRGDRPRFRQEGRDASAIVLAGISIVNALSTGFDFLETKVKAGCKLRFLLLHPDSDAVGVWNQLNKFPNVRRDIDHSLTVLRLLAGIAEMGQCEVRLSPVFLPYSMAIYDGDAESGVIYIELHGYKIAVDERASLVMSRAADREWFDHFKRQYEALWAKSEVWDPFAHSESAAAPDP